MKHIYSLKDDFKFIQDVQRATLETKKYGIVSEYGLFGSEQWWQAIGSGAVPVHSIEGIINKVYMSGHNDFPEFQIISEGSLTAWERKGDPSLYKEGDTVLLQYVATKNRFDHKVGKTQLNVWVNGNGT